MQTENLAPAAPPAAAPPSTPPLPSPPPEAEPERVVFSDVQQKKLDELIREAMSRAAKEVRKALEEEKQRNTDLEARLSETQRDLANERNLRQDAERREIASRRAALITQQCADLDLVDAETVISLTESNLPWNPTTESFDVVDNAGKPTDMTPAAFFADFATKKPHLVRSSVRLGSGARESSRTSLPIGGNHPKVEQIFGKGSSPRLANELAQRDPQTYRRLKVEAKRKGLI